MDAGAVVFVGAEVEVDGVVVVVTTLVVVVASVVVGAEVVEEEDVLVDADVVVVASVVVVVAADVAVVGALVVRVVRLVGTSGALVVVVRSMVVVVRSMDVVVRMTLDPGPPAEDPDDPHAAMATAIRITTAASLTPAKPGAGEDRSVRWLPITEHPLAGDRPRGTGRERCDGTAPAFRVRWTAPARSGGHHPRYRGTAMWSGRGDSNSRPPAPKAGTLTKLRYSPWNVTLYKPSDLGNLESAHRRGEPWCVRSVRAK